LFANNDNLVDYECGCAIEKDGNWRGCFTHWSQAVTKQRAMRKIETTS